MPKPTNDELVNLIRQDITAAQEVADAEAVQNERIYQYYRGKTMGNEVDGRSKIVSTDIFETVEWLIPALMDIFSPESGFPVMEPVGPEDVAPAEAMTQLIQYQFWRQNDGEECVRKAIKDCLMYRPGGIIKYGWAKVEGMKKTSWTGVPAEALPYMNEENGYKVTASVHTGAGYDVEGYRKFLEFDGPRLHVLPPWEFLRHPNAPNVKDSAFCAHKKRCTVDYIRRLGKQGYFNDYEKAIEESIKPPTDNLLEVKVYSTDNLERREEPVNDEARQEVYLYEVYGQYDVDGSGILENMKIYILGSTILRMDDNPYGTAPFVVLRDIEDTHKFSGIPIAELMEDLQRLRTFLIRQMADNMAQLNNATLMYDPTKVSQADIMNNVPGRNIRVKPGTRVADAIVPLTATPFSPESFNLLGYAAQMGEERTGLSKSFRSASDQYNTTATGQMAAINQASQRVRQIAKIIASSLADLFRAMIMMNKKFLTEQVWIRQFENNFVQIQPDDLEGRMDMNINVVMGAAARQQQILNLQQLLAIFGQLVPVGIPALDAKNTAEITREIVKNMGYKNQDRFLPQIFLAQPDQANANMQQEQMKQMMMEGGGGAGGATIGSMANVGTGGAATTNPAGAGGPAASIQPGAGTMAPGLGV
jgi:hypothetical protein